ncbi:MAG: amidohydrolase family protein, partial [Muribaculaceae bacterium]|nr:amidohydrolase family protein [Muribaculaceae bacterium]
MRQTPLAMQEYLSETTRAVANMITRDIPARYPNIKFVVPHCGAFLPLAIPRMKSLHPVMKANGLVGEIDWEKNLAAFYYDLAGSHSPQAIKMMLTMTEPTHILYGSDYPYANAGVLVAQLERMRQYLTDDPQLAPYREMFLSENARYLFGDRTDEPMPAVANDDELIVRIAEVEVHEQYLQDYLQAATAVGGTSVEKEPGVVCIFPMQVKESPNLIRIVEIYRNAAAYQAHLATDHFKAYKQGTLHMVKRLSLVDVSPLDKAAMSGIFLKK